MPSAEIRHDEGVRVIRICTVEVNEAQIKASIEPIGAVVRVPLQWERNFVLFDERQEEFEFESVTGQLLWHAGQVIAVSIPAFGNNGSPPNQIAFVLDARAAEMLEQLRGGGDAKLAVLMTVVILHTARVNLPRPNVGSAISRLVMRATSYQVTLNIEIAKSRYEHDLLPHLGLPGLGSVTINLPPPMRESIPSVARELQQAASTLQTATSEAHFESVVVQCRNAIYGLLSQFHLQLPKRADGQTDASFGTRVDAFRDQILEPVLGNTQAVTVGKILKALWTDFSAATKPGPDRYTRAYASFALHQAASVVSLISETATPNRT